MSDQHRVAHIINATQGGNPEASEQLLPLVCKELRRLAAQELPTKNNLRQETAGLDRIVGWSPQRNQVQ